MYAKNVSRNKEKPVHNRVEAVRSAHGLSRQQLADAVGVHYQNIGYLERGEYSPSLLLALRISATLNTQTEELFSVKPFKKGG